MRRSLKKLILFHYYAGFEINENCKSYYCGIEHEDWLFIKKIFKLSIVIIFITFVPLALLPFFYAIFGFPEPQHWFLAIESRYVHFKYILSISSFNFSDADASCIMQLCIPIVIQKDFGITKKLKLLKAIF